MTLGFIFIGNFLLLPLPSCVRHACHVRAYYITTKEFQGNPFVFVAMLKEEGSGEKA